MKHAGLKALQIVDPLLDLGGSFAHSERKPAHQMIHRSMAEPSALHLTSYDEGTPLPMQ